MDVPKQTVVLLEAQPIKRHNTHRWNMDNNKELKEAVELLKRHQAWRRDETGTLQMENPTELGKAIDLIIKHIEDDLQQTRI